jgi:hypothetical protein
VSIVGAPHPGFWRPPASPAHLLGIWGLDDTTIPYEASEDAPGPGVALATVDEADERGWYYTAARNVTRAWSLHHGGPAEPVSTNAYGAGDVSCATFVGASRETVECTVPAGHVCGRADEIDTALGFIQGRRGTSSSKSSAKSEAKSRPPRPWPSSSLLCFLVSSLSASSSTGAVRGRAASSSSSTCRP